MFRLTNFIAIGAQNYEAAKSFYENVLGFKKIKDLGQETEYKKDNIHLFVEANEKSPYQTFFEFEVDDFILASQKLLEAGCVITTELSITNAMFKDPYGMRFHVYQKGAEITNNLC